MYCHPQCNAMCHDFWGKFYLEMKHLPLFWNFWAEKLYTKKRRGRVPVTVLQQFFWQLFAHHHHLHRSWCHDEFFKDRDHLRGAMTEFFLSSQLSWLSFFSGYCTHRIRLQNSEELFWAFINIQLNSFCWFGFTDVVLLHPLLFNKLAHNVFVWFFRFCCIILSSCEKASWAAKGPKWGSRGEKGVKGWRQLVK